MEGPFSLTLARKLIREEMFDLRNGDEESILDIRNTRTGVEIVSRTGLVVRYSIEAGPKLSKDETVALARRLDEPCGPVNRPWYQPDWDLDD